MFTRLEATGSNNLLDAAALLASLVFKKENPAELNWLQRSLRKMHDILREAPLYQEILQEGREEGRQERIQALRQMLLKFVQARFPARKMIQLAKGQVALIEDPEVLQDLILKVGLAQTAEEAQNYLLEWPETEEMEDGATH
jgi:predicted transposase YdaD